MSPSLVAFNLIRSLSVLLKPMNGPLFSSIFDSFFFLVADFNLPGLRFYRGERGLFFLYTSGDEGPLFIYFGLALLFCLLMFISKFLAAASHWFISNGLTFLFLGDLLLTLPFGEPSVSFKPLRAGNCFELLNFEFLEAFELNDFFE